MISIFNDYHVTLDALDKEKQEQIQKIIEEVTNEKYEKIAELKASFDFMIKRLEA